MRDPRPVETKPASASPPPGALVLAFSGLSLVLLGVVAVELVRGPLQLRVGPVALPPRHLQLFAALGAAALALALLVRRRPLAPAQRALVVGLLAASAMLANTRFMGAGDSRPSALLPFALVRTHTLAFDALLRDNPCLQPDGGLPSWYTRAQGRTVSRYPLLTGLLALPLELPSALGPFPLCSPVLYDVQKLAASVLAALGVGFLFLAFEALVGTGVAALSASLYVLGTPVLPILGQALWQHTTACLGFSLALFALFAMRPGDRRSALVALGAALAVAARPPDAFLAVGVLLALAAEGRRYAWACLWGLLPLCILAAGNWDAFGAPWATGYGAEATHGWTAYWPEGFLGLLVSPGRGLLMLYPVLVFAVGGLLRGQPAQLRTRQCRLLAAGVLLHLVLMAKWWCWTGGYAPAPRMLSDALPMLGIGLALSVRPLLASREERPWFLSAALASMLCAGLVTYVYAPLDSTPHARIWNLTDGVWSFRSYPPVAYWLGRGDAGRRGPVP